MVNATGPQCSCARADESNWQDLRPWSSEGEDTLPLLAGIYILEARVRSADGGMTRACRVAIGFCRGAAKQVPDVIHALITSRQVETTQKFTQEVLQGALLRHATLLCQSLLDARCDVSNQGWIPADDNNSSHGHPKVMDHKLEGTRSLLNADTIEDHFRAESAAGSYDFEGLPEWRVEDGTSGRSPRLCQGAPWPGGPSLAEVSGFLLAETERGHLQVVEADGREEGADVAARLAKLTAAAGVQAIPILGDLSWAGSSIAKFSFERKALAEKGWPELTGCPQVWQVNSASSVFTNHIITVGRGTRATISGDDHEIHCIHRDWENGLLDSMLLGAVGRKEVILLAPDELGTDPRMPWKSNPNCDRASDLRGREGEDFWSALRQLAQREDVRGGRVELGPGDALFIPHGWWHAVRPLDPFTVITGLAKRPDACAEVSVTDSNAASAIESASVEEAADLIAAWTSDASRSMATLRALGRPELVVTSLESISTEFPRADALAQASLNLV
ncbi:retsat [Symbiodinium pilosum]|uniref:Retsat protein n=1 Tax=Symbiodinium pilosum TaxID=2952 RepID=A0A812SD30_SYMPI|nr:retsat [Symbiodinium pilosum]